MPVKKVDKVQRPWETINWLVQAGDQFVVLLTRFVSLTMSCFVVVDLGCCPLFVIWLFLTSMPLLRPTIVGELRERSTAERCLIHAETVSLFPRLQPSSAKFSLCWNCLIGTTLDSTSDRSDHAISDRSYRVSSCSIRQVLSCLIVQYQTGLIVSHVSYQVESDWGW